MDALMPLADQIAAAPGRYDQAVGDQYRAVTDRIEATRQVSFTAALLSRGETNQPHRIGVYASLLASHGHRQSDRKPFIVEESIRPILIALVHRWAEALLTTPNSKRHQMADVARAIGRLSAGELLPDLERLLALDLSRWRAAREMRRTSIATMSMEERSDAAHSWTLQYRDAFAAIDGDRVVEIMRQYLEHEDFGFDAGWVLKDIWDRQQNTPALNVLKSWPDFSDVRARRTERRSARAPEAASALAGMIFSAMERLAAPGSDEKCQRMAMSLARIGLAMPHGDQGRVIETLLGLPLPVRGKREFLAALILAGEVISADLVLQGVREWLDEAREKPWKYREGLWEIQGWLELLPFTERPVATIEGVDLVRSAFPYPQSMERVVSALGDAPDDGTEQIIGELMRRYPPLASQHDWVRTIVKRGSKAAGIMLMDIAADGPRTSGADSFWIGRELLALIQRHPDLRPELLRRYRAASGGNGRMAFEYAIAELGDAEAVLTLVRSYAARGQAFDGLLGNAIREAALSKEPAAGWADAYELHPVPLPELRKELFAMLQSTTANTAALAERCLSAIDELRDEYGSSEFEPRHPDVESDQPWPRAAG
jgi:hypothetical protein